MDNIKDDVPEGTSAIQSDYCNKEEYINFVNDMKRYYDYGNCIERIKHSYIGPDYDDVFADKYYHEQYSIDEILDKVLKNEFDCIFDFNDYNGEVINGNVIFSFIDKEYDKKIFCKVEICDNLNPNRWDLYDDSCSIYLNIYYCLDLDEARKHKFDYF